MGQLVCALFPWPGDQRSWISARRERGRGPAENTRSQEGTGVGRGGGATKGAPFGLLLGIHRSSQDWPERQGQKPERNKKAPSTGV